MTDRKRISFHVGLNTFDSTAFPTAVPLKSSAADAREMFNLACDFGFTPFDGLPRQHWSGTGAAPPNVLINQAATYETVVARFREAVALLQTGGDCLITFSSHGAQIPNVGDDQVQEGLFDEAVCLYNWSLLDDVLYGLLEEFSKDVNVFLVLDCCYAGTTSPNPGDVLDRVKMKVAGGLTSFVRRSLFSTGLPKVQAKPVGAPPALAVELETEFKDSKRTPLQAGLAVFAACGTAENTFDGENDGDLSVYTEKFVDAAHNGSRTVGELATAIANARPIPNCTPQFRRHPNDDFLKTPLKP